jgi:hypothetical protein
MAGETLAFIPSEISWLLSLVRQAIVYRIDGRHATT